MEDLFDYLDFAFVTPSYIGIERKNTLYSKVQFVNNNNKRDIHLNSNDLVVLGVNETRNSPFISEKEASLIVRKKLYALASIGIKGNLFDLGDIKETTSPDETYAALETVTNILSSTGVTIIIIGGSHELTTSLLKGLNEIRKHLNLCVVDYAIDYGTDTDMYSSQTFLYNVLNNNLINDLSVIGLQGYLTDISAINVLRNQNCETIRLGNMRKSICEVEPSFRNSDVVSFDIGSVRSCDSGATCYTSPNGLYAEEICQLSRYAGCSDRVKCMGVFGFIPEKDDKDQTSMLIAQVLWHFIEGVSLRKHEYPIDDKKNLKKFVTSLKTTNSNMVFYKSEISENWWMEVSLDSSSEVILIPCSSSDYSTACNLEIPERWYRNFCRMTNK